MGAAVEGAGGDDVAAAGAELEEDGGDGGHAAGGAVSGLGALDGGHEAAEVEHRRVEVAAVDEEVAVGAQLPGEHPPHRLRLHHRERRRRLDRHVHAAVLPELVPRARQRRRRVVVVGHHQLLRVAAAVGVVGTAAFLVGKDGGVTHGCVVVGDAEQKDGRF